MYIALLAVASLYCNFITARARNAWPRGCSETALLESFGAVMAAR